MKSIKYICKYVNKGSDQAAFGIENECDEVSKYEAERYISSSEAAWRILCFPSIRDFLQLFIILSTLRILYFTLLYFGQRVYFIADTAAEKVKNSPKNTILAFFDLSATNSFATGLLYSEVLAYYTWNNNKFSQRKQGKA